MLMTACPPRAQPSPRSRPSQAQSSSPAMREPVPWHTASAGIASLGTSIGIEVLSPALGELIVAIELAAMLAIIGTALFASPALSERAFRILRWIANRPESSAPQPARQRQQAKKTEWLSGLSPGKGAGPGGPKILHRGRRRAREPADCCVPPPGEAG
jgi:hypothetical protein